MDDGRYRRPVTLRPCTHTSEADWLFESGVRWGQAVSFGPSGFDAYARLRFIPDPVRDGQPESDVDLPDDHPTDWAQTWPALDVLRPFTTTSDRWYVCAWEGSGHTLPPEVFGQRLAGVPERRYFMAEGTSDDVECWESLFEDGEPVPAFVWPMDRAWCLTSDVDPHWAGIGGTAAAIEALVDSPLDVVVADPAAAQPAYR
jgi:hypothetical protein